MFSEEEQNTNVNLNPLKQSDTISAQGAVLDADDSNVNDAPSPASVSTDGSELGSIVVSDSDELSTNSPPPAKSIVNDSPNPFYADENSKEQILSDRTENNTQNSEYILGVTETELPQNDLGSTKQSDSPAVKELDNNSSANNSGSKEDEFENSIKAFLQENEAAYPILTKFARAALGWERVTPETKNEINNDLLQLAYNIKMLGQRLSSNAHLFPLLLDPLNKAVKDWELTFIGEYASQKSSEAIKEEYPKILALIENSETSVQQFAASNGYDILPEIGNFSKDNPAIARLLTDRKISVTDLSIKIFECATEVTRLEISKLPPTLAKIHAIVAAAKLENLLPSDFESIDREAFFQELEQYPEAKVSIIAYYFVLMASAEIDNFATRLKDKSKPITEEESSTWNKQHQRISSWIEKHSSALPDEFKKDSVSCIP
jgi:hypothetical protein